jgi:hypothetical protein
MLDTVGQREFAVQQAGTHLESVIPLLAGFDSGSESHQKFTTSTEKPLLRSHIFWRSSLQRLNCSARHKTEC